MEILIHKNREDFLKRFDNQKTCGCAQTALNVWDEFLRHLNMKESEVIGFMTKSDDRYMVLSHMTQRWKRKLSRSSMDNYFIYIKQWLKYCGIKLDDDLIKEHIRLPKKLKERPMPINRDVIKLLLENSNLVYKAFWLVLASTGMRPGKELRGLKVSDVDFSSDPPKVTIRGELAKNGMARICFLTPEASTALKKIIKDKKPNDLIFPFTYQAAWSAMNRVRRKLGLEQKTQNGKWNHLRIYKLRKFAETNLSNSVESEFAHAIIGHGKWQMTYYETPDTEMGEMFKQAIPKLTISDEQRLQDENEKLRVDKTEYQLLKKQNLEFATRLKRLEDLNKN